MASITKPTLESIITRYRREASRIDGSSPELEVRFPDINYVNFMTIYNALLLKQSKDGTLVNASDGSLTQIVGAIMDIKPSGRGEGIQKHLRPMRIREILFENGKRIHEQYVKKEPLLSPWRIPSNTGLTYIVALSAESKDQHIFSSDEGAVIRAKARVSFIIKVTGSSELKPELHWRIDMTVARQIMGSDASSSLKNIVSQMFATTPIMAPDTFLKALRIDDDANSNIRQLYRYEVEAEFIGPSENRDMIRPADVTAIAEMVLRLANPEYIRESVLQAEVYHVAKYIIKAPGYLNRFQHELGLKRLLPQALAITRADFRSIYPPKGFFLTEKADGKRAIASVHDGNGVIIADRLINGFSKIKTPNPLYSCDTILDGELITKDETIMFYAFDVIAVAGEDVTADPFEKRIDHMTTAVDIMQQLGMPVFAKKFAHLNGSQPKELEREIRSVYDIKHPYQTDGLIFVESGKSFSETANYKWKPAEHNTIDMLARRAPASVLGKAPYIDKPGYKLYFLFVGISPDLYDSLGLHWCPGYSDLFGAEPRRGRGARGQADDSGMSTGSYSPIQFAPSDAPLAYIYYHPDDSPHGTEIDGMIIEVRCAGECAAAGGGSTLVDWEVTRVREDRLRELATKKYFGNDYYTAEIIWLNYMNPFPIDQLWNGPALDYFMQSKSEIYRAQTSVISFIKTQRISALKHAGWVIDIGIGKGQDLGRYLDAEVQHLVAVDQDRAALSELVRRKYSFAKRNTTNNNRNAYRKHVSKAHTSTTIHILATNANEPFAKTLSKFETLGLMHMTADALVCNLAVHYFLTDITAMRNFTALARGSVKIGGQVILTVLIGEAVHETLKGIPNGGTWDIFEELDQNTNPVRKYSLKRLYTSEKLEAAGQRIGVLLPFSDGNYYEEYLVNTKALTDEFTSRGFNLINSTNAAKSIPEFATRNRVLANSLTAGDHSWLSLYGELIYTRVK